MVHVLLDAFTHTQQTDADVAKRVVLGDDGSSRLLVSGAFAEEKDVAKTRAALFWEFNTLAVVYGRPSAQFVSPHYQVKASAAGLGGLGGGLAPFSPTAGAAGGAAGGGAGANGNDLLDNNADDSLLPMGGDEEESGSPPRAAGAGDGGGGGGAYAGPMGVDLLDMAGLGASLPEQQEPQQPQQPQQGPAPPPQAQAQAPAVAALELVEGFALDPEAFQSLWAEYPEAGTYNVQCGRLPPGGLPDLEEALAQRRVSTLASGDLPEAWKLFLFAQDAAHGEVYLVQALLHKADRRLEATLKTRVPATARIGGGDPVDAFMEHISQALDALGMV